jgi:hypothetical protein
MIRAYVGEFGSGKTANMVWDLMTAMKKGRKVITNTPIKFWHDPIIGKKRLYEAECIAHGDQFLDALAYRENCIFAIDEAAVYLPNIYWSKMPPELIVKFAQQRKYRTDFYFTSQGFGHTVKRLRELTHIVLLCRRKYIFPFPHLRFKLFNKKIHLGPVMAFQTRAFNPAMFQGAWTQKKYERFHYYTRNLYPSQIRRIFKAYDTEYVVDMSAMMRVKGFKQPDKYDDEGKKIDQIIGEINEGDRDPEAESLAKSEAVLRPVASSTLLNG